jgi:hypothetical protein
MKNPPTLADACIASLLDKRMAGGPQPQNAPRDSYDQRLIDSRLVITPEPADER